MLPDQLQQPEGTASLRSGLLYLAAWLLVAAIEYRLVVASGGVRALFSDPLERPYPIFLLVVSIALLALAFRDLSSWARRKTAAKIDGG